MGTDHDNFLDDTSYPNIVTMPGTTATTVTKKASRPCSCGGNMIETLMIPEMKMVWDCEECGKTNDA